MCCAHRMSVDVKPPNNKNRKMMKAAIATNARLTILTRHPASGNPGRGARGFPHGTSASARRPARARPPVTASSSSAIAEAQARAEAAGGVRGSTSGSAGSSRLERLVGRLPGSGAGGPSRYDTAQR